MRISLQVLVAFTLILFLSYFAFLDVSKTIKNDLISKATKLYQHEKLLGVHVTLEGEGISTTRVLKLTGTVKSEEEKHKAKSLAQNIEGVLNVHSQIKIKKSTYVEKPIITIETKTPLHEKKIEKNQTITIKQEEEKDSTTIIQKEIKLPAIPKKTATVLQATIVEKNITTPIPITKKITVPIVPTTATVPQATLVEKKIVKKITEKNVTTPIPIAKKATIPIVPTTVTVPQATLVEKKIVKTTTEKNVTTPIPITKKVTVPIVPITVNVPVPVKIPAIPTAVKAPSAIVPQEEQKHKNHN